MKWVEETAQVGARIFKSDKELLTKEQGGMSNIIRACVRAYANSLREDRKIPLLPGAGEYEYDPAKAYPEVGSAVIKEPTDINEIDEFNEAAEFNRIPPGLNPENPDNYEF